MASTESATPLNPSVTIDQHFVPLDGRVGVEYLARGAAADIWGLVAPASFWPFGSTVNRQRVVHKVLRVGPLSRDLAVFGTEIHSDLWKNFLQDYRTRVEQWKFLRHENLVQVMGFGDELNLKVEFCERGSVREYLESQPRSYQQKARIIVHVLSGLEYMHTLDPPIVHGNLNAGKLFIDASGTTKIGEFGLAALCHSFAAFVPSVSLLGLSRWLGPELLKMRTEGGPLPTRASDMWALGCTLYEIVAESIPYSNCKHDMQVRRSIRLGKPPGERGTPFQEGPFERIWPLLVECWETNPRERPFASNMLTRVAQRFAQEEGLFIEASAKTDENVDDTQGLSRYQRRNEDAQSLYGGVEPAQTATSALSRRMSSETMFRFLVEWGCPNMTLDMNLKRQPEHLVAPGRAGDIYRCELQDGTSVAIKTWRSFEYQEKDVKHVIRGIYNWSRMDHDNVHKLLGAVMLDGRIGTVSKWMDNGDLRTYIHRNQEVNRLDLCLQVTRGVQYLHNAGLLHGDLKAANILVSGEGIPKLTGFDRWAMSDEDLIFFGDTQAGGGSFRWTAPELLVNKASCGNKQTDIYALGMTLLEIITGVVPYSECKEEPQAILSISQGRRPERTEHFTKDERGDGTWELLLKCWDHPPDARPTADRVLQSLNLLIDTTTPLQSLNLC